MITNIKDFYEKHKYLGKSLKNELLSILVVFLVGISSFGLGILFERDQANQVLVPHTENSLLQEKIDQKALVLDADKETEERGGEVVASKSGKKYHFPWCGGAKQISEKNKIFFKSIEDARKAGYLPASNCKGLK